MKVFITGGGGFLGQHIIQLLLEEGHSVTSYSRGNYPELEKQGVKTIQGSLDELTLLKNSMLNHDVVFHTASKVAMWGSKQDFYETNFMGTKNIIQSCLENEIPHLVYTSTPSVVFGEDSISNGDETLHYPQKSYSRYAASKTMAEDLIIKSNSEVLKTVSLRPHLIFGPGDRNLIPRLVEARKKGKLKIIGDGKNLVDVLYVKNAAKAHLLAWKALKNNTTKVEGQSYFLGQGPVPLWDFINKILAHYKLPPVKKKVSYKLAFFIGTIIESFSEAFKVYNYHPPMTRFVALQLSKNHYFNHKKAKEDLNWEPEISLEEALSSL